MGLATCEQLKLTIESIESAIISLGSFDLTELKEFDDLDQAFSSSNEALLALSSPVKGELDRLSVFLRTLRELFEDSPLSTEVISELIAEVISELIAYTWARAMERITPLSLSTRLGMWSRLWISLSWRYGQEEWKKRPLDQSIAKSVRDHVRSLNIIAVNLRSDPYWSTADLYKQRGDFFAEESLAYLLSQRSSFSVSLAPLEADVLQGLDLSVKRKSPKAKGWIQLSLSGEGDVHLKKIERLKRSAACCVLSPWSLCEYLRTPELSPAERLLRDSLWTKLNINYSTSWSLQTEARALGQAMKTLLGVSLNTILSSQGESQEVRETLAEISALYLHSQLGVRARRTYRRASQVRALTAPPLTLINYLTDQPRL